MSKPLDLTRFDFHALRFRQSETVMQMTAEEVGQYVLLMVEAWLSGKECSLPNNPKLLAIYARCQPGKPVSELVMSCWTERDGRLYNERLSEEYEAAKERATARHEKAKKGAAARYGRDKNAPSIPEASSKNAPTPNHSTPTQSNPSQSKLTHSSFAAPPPASKSANAGKFDDEDLFPPEESVQLNPGEQKMFNWAAEHKFWASFTTTIKGFRNGCLASDNFLQQYQQAMKKLRKCNKCTATRPCYQHCPDCTPDKDCPAHTESVESTL